MWDLKLLIFNFFFLVSINLEAFFFFFINFTEPFIFDGLSLTNLKIAFRFTYNSSIFFTLKFLCAIGFLILVRGGTPRYRYDYLTKLGWLKFIGLVITVFFFSIASFFSF